MKNIINKYVFQCLNYLSVEKPILNLLNSPAPLTLFYDIYLFNIGSLSLVGLFLTDIE